MLETAMVLLIFLTLLGAVCDLGVALYQYSVLRHTANLAARDITVALASKFELHSQDCNQFDSIADAYFRGKATYLMDKAGSGPSRFEFDYCMKMTSPLRTFKVSLVFPANCFFLCRFLPRGWELKANASVSVDSRSIPDCRVRDCG